VSISKLKTGRKSIKTPGGGRRRQAQREEELLGGVAPRSGEVTTGRCLAPGL